MSPLVMNDEWDVEDNQIIPNGELSSQCLSTAIDSYYRR